MSMRSNSSTLNVNAVILDYGQVLCHPPSADCIERMARVFYLSPRRFRYLYQRNRLSYDRGDLTPQTYWTNLAADAGMKLKAADLEKLCQWDVEMWSTVSVPMIEWVEKLRSAGLKTALLSNMQAAMAKHVHTNFAWLSNFDCTVFSAEVGAVKPEAAIYHHCLQRLKVAASEALFIDDGEANVAGAQAVGITSIRFQSPSQLRAELEVAGFAPLPSAGP